MSDKKKSELNGIKKRKLDVGYRYIFYGPEGVGKSTLASSAPDPIFIDCEGGTSSLEVARYPFGEFDVPSSFSDVVDALHRLLTEPHDFKTVVIDTIDKLESLIWDHCMKVDGGANQKYKSIEDYGYGKGYSRALDFWKNITHASELLAHRRKINTIFLGHAQVRPFKNPEADDYDRYALRIHDRAGGHIKGQCDVIGFCTFEEGAGSLDGKRAKGWSTGRRLLKLERTATFDAKSRLPLPPEVEMTSIDPWQPLAEAILDGQTTTAEKLVGGIAGELERLNADDVLVKKVNAAIDSAKGDVVTLNRYLNDLKRRQIETPKEEAQNNVK